MMHWAVGHGGIWAVCQWGGWASRALGNYILGALLWVIGSFNWVIGSLGHWVTTKWTLRRMRQLLQSQSHTTRCEAASTC